MIGEFAFTPSVFDQAAHEDAESWRDQLRELGSAMFPRTAAWPVMVANLYDGSWFSVAMEAVKAIKDDKARILCEGILDNIKRSLVYRPNAAVAWPTDDFAWGKEALGSHQVESIDRIISCEAVQNALKQECQTVRCIDEVQTNGFWGDISSQWSQPLNIPSQVQALRKLALHAEFLCLITPHVRGSADDETTFTRELVRSAFDRPERFRNVEIEVHTEGPDKPASADFAQRLQNVVVNTTTSLLQSLRPGQSLRLVLWPKLLDRYLIAGVYTETSGGIRVRSPRWGISMQHIARRVDSQGAHPPTAWSLMTRDQLGDVFTRYCTGKLSTSLHDSVISAR